MDSVKIGTKTISGEAGHVDIVSQAEPAVRGAQRGPHRQRRAARQQRQYPGRQGRRHPVRRRRQDGRGVGHRPGRAGGLCRQGAGQGADAVTSQEIHDYITSHPDEFGSSPHDRRQRHAARRRGRRHRLRPGAATTRCTETRARTTCPAAPATTAAWRRGDTTGRWFGQRHALRRPGRRRLPWSLLGKAAKDAPASTTWRKDFGPNSADPNDNDTLDLAATCSGQRDVDDGTIANYLSAEETEQGRRGDQRQDRSGRRGGAADLPGRGCLSTDLGVSNGADFINKLADAEKLKTH